MFIVDDYVFEKIIGKGSFGKVYKVHKNSNKYTYAIKVLNLPLTAQIDKLMIINEIRFLSCHNSSNIIEYSTVFLKNNSIYIVMEYAQNGDLSQLINKHKIKNTYFSESVIFNYFIQIAQAIQYLHNHNIIHRDIKTANIFIDNKNKLKLGDFGIIKILSGSYMQTSTLIGTPLNMPPELYRKQRYNTKFDIWSLGCVLYEMMTYNPPFIGKTLIDLKYKIFAGKYNIAQLKIYSLDLRNIVVQTLNTNAQIRPSINQLLKSPLIHMKVTITNNYNIKPLFFEPYNIPKKPSDWNAIIKKYAQPTPKISINPPTPTAKLPYIPTPTAKPLYIPTAKPLYIPTPFANQAPQLCKKATPIIPHPPQNPKPISTRPRIKPFIPPASPIYNPSKNSKPISARPRIKTYLPLASPHLPPTPPPPPPPTPIPSSNIKINISASSSNNLIQNQKMPTQHIQDLTLILSNSDNNEIRKLNNSINKLQQNIQELYAQLDIKSYRLNHLKIKRQAIIENNKLAINAIKNDNNTIHSPLIPTQPFKKITQEISVSKDQLNIRKDSINQPQPSSKNSNLIIKIGSKHDHNYFLNQ